MSFTETTACKSKAHCRTCRNDQGWRGRVGAPEICPHGITEKGPFRDNPAPKIEGFGDLVSFVATPIAKAIGMPCVDKKTGRLREDSGCAKRKNALNKLIPLR